MVALDVTSVATEATVPLTVVLDPTTAAPTPETSLIFSRMFPRMSGPTFAPSSSKLFGSAETAAPALLVISLNTIVGREVSRWIGVKGCSLESTTTEPPPNRISAFETEFRNAEPPTSESERKTRPPHCPPEGSGPNPSLSPPTVSSWYEVKVTRFCGIPSTCKPAPALEDACDDVPTSIMAFESLKMAPSSTITVTPAGTLRVAPSSNDI